MCPPAGIVPTTCGGPRRVEKAGQSPPQGGLDARRCAVPGPGCVRLGRQNLGGIPGTLNWASALVLSTASQVASGPAQRRSLRDPPDCQVTTDEHH